VAGGRSPAAEAHFVGAARTPEATRYTIDFSLVANLQRPTVFTVLPPAVQSALSQLPETLGRAEAAVHFVYRMHSLGVLEQTRSSAPLSLREAYFGAALSEFCSMDETLPRDLAAKGVADTALRITDLHNPLLHVMRELRHLNVHLISSTLSRASRPAIWHDQKFDYEMWLVTNLDGPTFRTLHNAVRYAPADIQALINWFNREQAEWGADHLLFLAICAYSEAIVSRYHLAA
jgi:hypothetical protein